MYIIYHKMASIMEQSLKNEYPNYGEVNKKMYDYLQRECRQEVLEWISEFNEAFYPFMCKVVDILNDIDEDDFMEREDAGIGEEEEKFIKWFGGLLHRRGGLTTQQAIFYIMCNFMECRRVSVLRYVWDGIGEWRH